jgi:hypothetical protein
MAPLGLDPQIHKGCGQANTPLGEKLLAKQRMCLIGFYTKRMYSVLPSVEYSDYT